MTILEAIILGIIQGITEFLPISSSAHLVIWSHLFGLTDPSENLAFIVFLHFASVLAIIMVLLPELLQTITKPRLVGLVIIGTIPAAVVGLLFKDTIERWFASLQLIGIALIINAIILTVVDLDILKGCRNIAGITSKLNLIQAFFIGLAQAVAIMPGISRSGITISTGIIGGLERKEAINFSFYLGIFAILGASVLKMKDFSKFTASFEPISILIGGVTCFLVSYLAIKLLIKLVLKSRLYYFSIYCLLLGLSLVGYSFYASTR